jgi:diguanylate cyclase (GGDEF)-like protein/PAS domain S-box-containing protein
VEDGRQRRGSQGPDSDQERLHAPVLVVEDDAAYAGLLQTWLERAWSHRVDVVQAPSLHAARRELETWTPSCVLLDLGLPDAAGLEVVNRILEVARAPVIVVTGLDDEALGLEALELGAQDFVVKGQADAAMLRRSVRYAIERHQTRERLRESERKFRLLAENAHDFIFRYRVGDEPGFDYASPASLSITGYSPAELYADPALVLSLVGDDHLAAMDHLARSEELARPWEVQVVRKDGSAIWIEQRLTAVHGESGELEAIEGIVRDITERRRVNEQLLHQTLHDPLTGLANRVLLRDRLDQALARARRTGVLVGVLFFDLDRFGLINDSRGHDAGDAVLVTLAERLEHAVRPADTVARLGGDEFVVVCDGLVSDWEASVLADRMARVLAAPVQLDGTDICLSASVGVAVATGEASADSLLRDANAAMYEAKHRGRGSAALYEEGLRLKAEARLTTESAMRGALEKGQFLLHYQPIVSLTDGRLVGAEALVRWDHPELGLVPPAEFIPLAEETGLIVPIGAWVLDQACATLGRWSRKHQHGAPAALSVNLSARQLLSPGLLDAIKDVLAAARVTPSSLVLEITEGALMEDVEFFLETLAALRAIGVRLAIDDFGTGYSSLSYLKRFAVDSLKIDRTFVDGLGSDPHDSAIVAAILAMARALDLSVVAEGVETDEQLQALRTLGCQAAQGYLFSRPVDEQDFAKLLARDPRWDVWGPTTTAPVTNIRSHASERT